MGDTAPKAEAIHLTETAAPHPSSPDNPCADGPVDPAEIRFRPGIRREGAFTVRYVTIHGYRRAYVRAGSGPALLLIHGIGDSSDTWRPVVEQLAEHYTVIAPDLLGHGRSEKPRADYSVAGFANGMPRPSQRAGGRPGHRRGAFTRRRRGRTVRLPVPRSLRAPGPGGQRRRGQDGQPAAPRGGGARHRTAHAVPRTGPDPLRQPPGCGLAACPRHRARTATPRRSWPCSTRCRTPRPAWPS